MGGFSEVGRPTNTVDVLSEMTQMWEESAPLHEARGFHASCVHENRVFVAGARTPNNFRAFCLSDHASDKNLCLTHDCIMA